MQSLKIASTLEHLPYFPKSFIAYFSKYVLGVTPKPLHYSSQVNAVTQDKYHNCIINIGPKHGPKLLFLYICTYLHFITLQSLPSQYHATFTFQILLQFNSSILEGILMSTNLLEFKSMIQLKIVISSRNYPHLFQKI